MVLNEFQLLARLYHPDHDKRIVITPLIDPRHQFGPASLDLRLGYEFKVGRTSGFTHLDVLLPVDELRLQVSQYTDEFQIQPLQQVVLHPQQFLLGSTLEYIRLPDDITGRIEGRSSWGRMGLEVHATAGFVDPGFRGCLTFELKNVGSLPLSVYAGVRIAQMTFYEGEPSAIPYSSKVEPKYADGIGTVGSLVYTDPEFDRLRTLTHLKASRDAAVNEVRELKTHGEPRARIEAAERRLAGIQADLRSHGL